MELSWLEDFLALAEVGNFSRAAATRHVTQPAFSRRIRSLEGAMGASLFDRGQSGVTLTPSGLALRPAAEDIVRRVREARRNVRRVAKDEGATLLFAATHALSFTFLPNWMRELERDAPLGPLSLVSDSLQGCETLMLQGDVQFLLCHHHRDAPGRFAPARYHSRAVGTDRLEPFCAPTIDGCPRWSLDAPAEDIPYLAYSAESGLGRILEATVLRDPGVAPLRAVVTSHLAVTLASLARDSRGVAWLPRELVRDDLTAGRLVRCGGEQWTVPMDIVVVRPSTPLNRTAERLWTQIWSGGVSPR